MIVGDETYIGPFAVLGAGGALSIGSRCQIGAGVHLIAEEHRTDSATIFGAGVDRKGIVVGDDVWIGDGVYVLDGVRIGDGAVVGAGSVVTRSVPDRAVVVGTPARVLRYR